MKHMKAFVTVATAQAAHEIITKCNKKGNNLQGARVQRVSQIWLCMDFASS